MGISENYEIIETSRVFLMTLMCIKYLLTFVRTGKRNLNIVYE